MIKEYANFVDVNADIAETVLGWQRTPEHWIVNDPEYGENVPVDFSQTPRFGDVLEPCIKLLEKEDRNCTIKKIVKDGETSFSVQWQNYPSYERPTLTEAFALATLELGDISPVVEF